MKLYEAEIEHGYDTQESHRSQPPRPEKRRVYRPILITLAILAGTVGAVYAVFPPRNNEILTVVTEAHRQGGEFELKSPSIDELQAWSLGVMGDSPPWPELGDDLVGAARLKILNRSAVLARYRRGDYELTIAILRARDAPPRKHRRRSGDLVSLSWRVRGWTVVAVGPWESASKWAAPAGAPF